MQPNIGLCIGGPMAGKIVEMHGDHFACHVLSPTEILPVPHQAVVQRCNAITYLWDYLWVDGEKIYAWLPISIIANHGSIFDKILKEYSDVCDQRDRAKSALCKIFPIDIANKILDGSYSP